MPTLNAAELQWIPTLDLEPDHDCTPLQHTHRMAMAAPARTALELDIDAREGLRRANRALRVYHRATHRPRKVGCWDFVACELWNGRQDAVRSGAVLRGTDEYEFISARYRDAIARAEYGRFLEARGHSDVRV